MDANSTNGRFPFSVKLGDTAMIAMDCGGVIRARHMPRELLERIGEACQELMTRGNDWIIGHPNDAPQFPQYGRIMEAIIPGSCRITLGVHKLDRRVELVIALYDEEDDTAPVLVLIEEQIVEFVRMTT